MSVPHAQKWGPSLVNECACIRLEPALKEMVTHQSWLDLLAAQWHPAELRISSEQLPLKRMSYLNPSLEDKWLGSWTPTECKRTDCGGGAVLEPVEHLVQALMAQGVKKPFATVPGQHHRLISVACSKDRTCRAQGDP